MKPITAKPVQERHQIDLLDMTEWKVSHGRATYKYVLTVHNVFSRYVWLKAPRRKTSHEIAQHLANIYMEHGPPKVLQHDQGCVQRCCEKAYEKHEGKSPEVTISPTKPGEDRENAQVFTKKDTL